MIIWNPWLLNLIVDMNGQQLAEAPSWVPDWTTTAQTNWISSSEVYDMTKLNSFSHSMPEPQNMKLRVVGQVISIAVYSSGRFTSFEPEVELEWTR